MHRSTHTNHAVSVKQLILVTFFIQSLSNQKSVPLLCQRYAGESSPNAHGENILRINIITTTLTQKHKLKNSYIFSCMFNHSQKSIFSFILQKSLDSIKQTTSIDNRCITHCIQYQVQQVTEQSPVDIINSFPGHQKCINIKHF